MDEEVAEEEEQEQEHDGDSEADDTTGGSPFKLPLLRLSPSKNAVTPQRQRLQADDRLTSSALRGGAANGLLSLARGQSS